MNNLCGARPLAQRLRSGRTMSRVEENDKEAVDRVQALETAVADRQRELKILAEVASKVHGEDEVQAILDIALEEILSRLGLKTAWVFMADERSQRLRLAASRGVSPVYLEEVAANGLGECLCPEVLASGHRMQARNTTQCPRMPTIVDGLAVPVAHACIPLRFEGASRGVLNVANRPGALFTDDELRFLETLGHQIGLAVERARHLHTTRAALDELKSAQARIIHNEKMAVLGTFASGLAHEVRNPLNSISLQLSVLERRIARAEGLLAGQMTEVVDVIREEISRLELLVEDFLLFSRTDRIQYRPARLEDIVHEVMQLMAPEAAASSVAVRHAAEGPAPRMHMDAEKMKQVVINLVRNAIEAMPKGGAVEVRTGMADGRARIVVTDDGPGLPPGVDVFQLFVTTKPKGTGLGLSIVQQIVLQHGGEIFAGRGPKGGARFTIAIPVLPAEDAVAPQEAKS
jgi:signal transduction histidine kinase